MPTSGSLGSAAPRLLPFSTDAVTDATRRAASRACACYLLSSLESV